MDQYVDVINRIRQQLYCMLLNQHILHIEQMEQRIELNHQSQQHRIGINRK